MRLRVILTIVRKELRERLRDRRALLMTIGLPLLVYPLVFIGFMRIAESGQQAMEAERSTVALWGRAPDALGEALGSTAELDMRVGMELPDEIRAGLESGVLEPAPARTRPSDSAAARRLGGAPPAGSDRLEEDNPVLRAAREVVTGRRADAVVVIWPALAPSLAADDAGPLTIYFDSVRPESEQAAERVEDRLREARTALVAERQRARALPSGFSQAFEILGRDVAPDERRAGLALGRIVPYMLLTLAIVGGLYAALDTTAGEKERGTMQTLLCAPVTPSEIVVAKFIGVWVLSLVGVATNVASLSLAVSSLLPADMPGLGGVQVVIAAALLVPVTLTTSALFLAFASFARDFRDGQNMLTPLYMAVALPSAVVMLPTIELDPWMAFVPIVNIALLIKGLFVGDVSADLIFLTLVSATTYAALAIAAAVHVFHRDTVLVGGRETLRTTFSLRTGQPVPTASLALTAFAVALVAQFYVSLGLRDLPLPWLLAVIQLGGFLLPLVVLVRVLGFDARRTLGLTWPRPSMLALSVVIGMTGWVVAGGIVARLLPPPDSVTKAMQRLIQLGDEPMPLAVVWLVLGLLPGVCEELFFRGFVFAGLRRLGAVSGLVLTALCFGVAHASIYRLLPTFTMGLILGLVRWRTGSIVCSVIVHTVNNGLIATLAQRPDLIRLVGLSPEGTMAEGPTAVGTALLAAALAVLVRLTRSTREDVTDAA